MKFSEVAACCAGMEACGVQVGSNDTSQGLVLRGSPVINGCPAKRNKLSRLDTLIKEKFDTLLRISIAIC